MGCNEEMTGTKLLLFPPIHHRDKFPAATKQKRNQRDGRHETNRTMYSGYFFCNADCYQLINDS